MRTKKERREKAMELLKVSDALTPKQKLENLDKKFGTGKGAKRERTRLAELIAHNLGDTPFGQIKKS